MQVSWHGGDDEKKRKSWRSASALIVIPLDNPVKPTKVGDEVLTNAGGRWAHHFLVKKDFICCVNHVKKKRSYRND